MKKIIISLLSHTNYFQCSMATWGSWLLNWWLRYRSFCHCRKCCWIRLVRVWISLMFPQDWSQVMLLCQNTTDMMLYPQCITYRNILFKTFVSFDSIPYHYQQHLFSSVFGNMILSTDNIIQSLILRNLTTGRLLHSRC